MGLAAVRMMAALSCCAIALAGCDLIPGATATFVPVATEAEAVTIAKEALQGIPDADEPFRVSLDQSGWVVTTTPRVSASGQINYAVHINRKTGEADVGVYQVAHIDEDF